MLLSELTRIDEMIWEDRFTAGEMVKKYPNQLIHFTNVNKLGVNPRKEHKDAPGIYFYPCKWLTSEEASSSQYATEYKFYYVCSLRKTKNVLNLGKITKKDAIAFATKNGWLDDLTRIEKNRDLLDTDGQPMEPELLRKAGGFLWASMDFLVNVENRSWMSLVGDIDAIIDPGFGFIARGEPAQTIVFKRNLLTILAHGENVDRYPSIIANSARALAKEFNANITFKTERVNMQNQNKYYYQKFAILDFMSGSKPIQAKIALFDTSYPIEMSYFKDGHWVTKADRDFNTGTGDLENRMQSLRYQIRKAVDDADDTAGEQKYWTADKLTKIVKMLRPVAINVKQSIRDGLLRVYCSDSWGMIIFFVGAETDGDVLKFSFDLSIGREDRDYIKCEASFKSGTSEQAVANEIRKQFRERVKSLATDEVPDRPNAILKYFNKSGWDV